MTIRRYASRNFSMDDLIARGMLPRGQAADLAGPWNGERMSSSPGGTSTGKITLLNMLADAIPAQERILIIEDAAELHIHTRNYRNRLLNPLAKWLGLPRLNFQILRRTMATQAQRMGSVKDIQAHLRHAKADTTANEYMQELPESVKKMVGGVYTMLKKGGDSEINLKHLPQNATNFFWRASCKCLKGMVGTSGFEPLTSTVSR